MNLKKALKIALKAARKAAKIQKKNYGKKHEYHMKSGHDYATQTDLDCEKVILETLKKSFPDHKYIAEESKNSDKDLQAEYCWTIDPLDGTHCFANEIPFFGPMIALLHKGDPVVAVAILPMLNEEFTAIKGQGTYLNDKQIKIKKTSKIEGQPLVSSSTVLDLIKQSAYKDFTNPFFVPAAIGMTRQLLKKHCAIGYGGTCWKIWDEAPTALLVREAGGKTVDQKGRDLKHNEINFKNQGIKIYTNPLALKKAQSYLKK